MKTIVFSHCDGRNAGDQLCTPLLYYNFGSEYATQKITLSLKPLPSFINNTVVIYGGGGIIDTSKDRNEYYKNLNQTNTYIHWGSGANKLNLENVNWVVANTEKELDDDVLENFAVVGRRDYIPKYYPNHKYVPCVTCKIKQLKFHYDIKRRIGIVEHMWLHKIDLNYDKVNMSLDSNNTIEKLIRFIGESEIIITSSFHGCYWGLLMGKKVIIKCSWSSKFDTLKYKPTPMTNDIEEDIKRCKIAPQHYLDECIKLNDDFYEEVMGIIQKHFSKE